MTTAHFASVKTIVVICVICASIDGGTCLSQDETTLISAEGRTFGHHFLKRISFAVIPAAFVVGVMTSLLAMLTVMSMKGLGIGVLLLILGLSQVLSRAFHHSLPVSSPYPIVYSHHSRSDQSQAPVWTKEDLATGPYSAYGH